MVWLRAIILVVSTLGIAWCSVRLWRNGRVYKFRRSLLEAVHSDIEKWEQRHQEFELVSYDDMMRKPWQSLESFYEGTELLAYWRSRQELERLYQVESPKERITR